MASESAAYALGHALGSSLFALLVFAGALAVVLGYERRTRPRGGAARSPGERARLLANWSWLFPSLAIGCTILTLGIREPSTVLLKSIAGSLLILVGLGAGVWALVVGRRTDARGIVVPAALGVGGTLLMITVGALGALMARTPRPVATHGPRDSASVTLAPVVPSVAPAPRLRDDAPEVPDPLVSDLRLLPGSEPGERVFWLGGVLIGALWADGEERSTVRRWSDLGARPVAVAPVDGVVVFAQAVPAREVVALGVNYVWLDDASLRKPSAILLVDPKSGASTIAAEAFAGLRFRFDVPPVWSPDGKQVAVLGQEDPPRGGGGASDPAATTRVRIFDTKTRRASLVPTGDGVTPFSWDGEGLLLVESSRLGSRQFLRWDPRSPTATATPAPLTASSPSGRFRIEVTLDGVRISARTGEPRRFEPSPSERLGVARLKERLDWVGDKYLVLDGEALKVLDLEAVATRYLTSDRTARFVSARADGARILVRTSDGSLRVGTVP